jgi:hypothetical protein
MIKLSYSSPSQLTDLYFNNYLATKSESRALTFLSLAVSGPAISASKKTFIFLLASLSSIQNDSF